jgi:hypothetical protein
VLKIRFETGKMSAKKKYNVFWVAPSYSLVKISILRAIAENSTPVKNAIINTFKKI